MSTPISMIAEDDKEVVSPRTTSKIDASSFFAALSRALFMSLAFLFKRPVRLFRPVKISTYAGLSAIAEEKGLRKVTPAFVRSLMRKEGWRFIPNHVLPPLLANGVIGLTLFSVYTVSSPLSQNGHPNPNNVLTWDRHSPSSRQKSSESYLNNHLSPSTTSSQILIPFISGTLAGSAQSIISSPLDTARLLLLRRQQHLRRFGPNSTTPSSKPFISWSSLLKQSLSISLGINSTSNLSLKNRKSIEIRKSSVLWFLSLMKDGLGFGSFFTMFELGRNLSRTIGLRWDGIEEYEKIEENDWDLEKNESAVIEGNERKRRRSAISLVLQSIGILASGAIAGLSFALIARPFDRIKMALYEARLRHFYLQQANQAKNGQAQKAGEHNRRGLESQQARASRTLRTERKHRIRFLRIRGRSRLASLAVKASTTRPTTAWTPLDAPARVSNTSQPSVISVIRASSRRIGALNFFFGSTSSLRGSTSSQRIAGIGTGVDETSAPSSKSRTRYKLGPTRLSARGRQAKAILESGNKGIWARGSRILAYGELLKPPRGFSPLPLLIS